ncbi:MAG: shikimate kinase [Verrucomicrobiota bacterium]
MKTPRHISNLALIGFMGAGKSSAGRLVAEQLGFKFVDTDELIETRTGKSITQIFADQGEAHFRELEHQLCIELGSETDIVISTGGGLPTRQENIENLKQHALVICLWCSAEQIWERVRHQSHRPLLQTPDPEAKIRELLAVRAPFYRQADILLNTQNRSQRQVVQQVVAHFKEARKKSP